MGVEGWKLLLNSRKAHYFREGMALCNKWAYFGDDLEDDTFESIDDCATCKKKLAKEKEKIKNKG
jgi:hypothetical protein